MLVRLVSDYRAVTKPTTRDTEHQFQSPSTNKKKSRIRCGAHARSRSSYCSCAGIKRIISRLGPGTVTVTRNLNFLFTSDHATRLGHIAVEATPRIRNSLPASDRPTRTSRPRLAV